MRFLLLIVVIFLLVFLFRALSAAYKSKTQGKQEQAKLKKIVPCKSCHLHIPVAEAIQYQNHYFCSDTHLKEWKSANT